MNIEVLQDHIKTFTREVVDSGFKRDLDDYCTSIPASQNNIVALREMAGKVLSVLDRVFDGDLPASLGALLPTKQVRPFTETPHSKTLRAMIENTETPQQKFFTELSLFLNQLKNQIQQNFAEIAKVRDFLAPYITAAAVPRAQQNVATLSIAFKEPRTISSLGQFTKTLAAWNRALPVYHQLLRSESPEDITIVEIQNGSIDLVINLNADVAVDLVGLFKIGFQCYVAYLSYKSLIKPIVGTYRGNPKLLEGEKEREVELLENIGTAVRAEVLNQYKAAKKADKSIHSTSVEKKADEITQLVVSHIIKGNDVKLLALPETKGQESETDVAGDLRDCSAVARSKLRALPAMERQKLLERYGKIPEPETEKDQDKQAP